MLHLASYAQHASVVEHLMGHCRPRLDIRNEEGLNPMEVCQSPQILAIYITAVQKMKQEIEKKKKQPLRDITNMQPKI